jgi:hypothetical protein
MYHVYVYIYVYVLYIYIATPVRSALHTNLLPYLPRAWVRRRPPPP